MYVSGTHYMVLETSLVLEDLVEVQDIMDMLPALPLMFGNTCDV
jgi:hypothetical protein